MCRGANEKAQPREGGKRSLSALDVEAAPNLDFDFEVKSHDRNQLQMKINWANPSGVSLSERAQLWLQLQAPQVFVSQHQLRSVSFMSSNLEPQVLPPQRDESETTKLQASVLGNFILFAVVACFAILHGLSTKQSAEHLDLLWCLVRQLQIIFAFSLISVTMTASEYTFVKTLARFWQFDVLKGSYHLSRGLEMHLSLPVSLHFENFGLTTKSLVLNTGSILPLQVFISASVLLRWLLNKVCLFYPKNEKIRAFGMVVYIRNRCDELVRLTFRLLEEGYFIICVATFLCIRQMAEIDDMSVLFSQQDVVQSSGAIGVLVSLLLAPLAKVGQLWGQSNSIVILATVKLVK